MDHFRPDPAGRRRLGGHARELDHARLPGRRDRAVRLGTLVTGVTYRNVAHLGKIAATLDVLSGGRAVCGLGAAWFEAEHRAYGWTSRRPPSATAARGRAPAPAAHVGDGLAGLRGPAPSRCRRRSATPARSRSGSRSWSAATASAGPCDSSARYADACNVFGDAATVRHKVEVLRAPLRDVGTATRRGRGHPAVDGRVVRGAGRRCAGSARRAAPGSCTRLRCERPRRAASGSWPRLGVQTAMVSIAGLADGPDAVERFAPVIAAFR